MRETAREFGPIEKLLTLIEEPPWDAIHRIAIGFVIVPTLSRAFGEDLSAWALALAFIGILLALRCVPAVLRRAVPVSERVQAAWTERRRLAKRYDSYQWQKLFWFGIGLSLHTAFVEPAPLSRVVLELICLTAGGIGLAIWRARKALLDARLMSAPPKISL